MELIIVGKYSVGVHKTADWVVNYLGGLIGAKFSQLNLNSPVKTIVFFPTIVDPVVATSPDNVSYKKKEPAIYMSINISHEEWMSSDRSRRVDLFAGALCIGIGKVKDSKISIENKGVLIGVVDDARRSIKVEFC